MSNEEYLKKCNMPIFAIHPKTIIQTDDDIIALKGNLLDSVKPRGMFLLLARRTLEELMKNVVLNGKTKEEYISEIKQKMHFCQKFVSYQKEPTDESRTKYCDFCYCLVKKQCFRIGMEPPSANSFGPWSTHDLHIRIDGTSLTMCPLLRCQVCAVCKATGRSAHTRDHCPVVGPSKTN
ncbi:unnamed protein product [Caenorhabditis bovis]|nr:unnamed protein product [Caenorhabditis bovis]